MTSDSRISQAEQVELLYYWALGRLGNAVALDALDLWEQVPASSRAARAAWWLSRLMEVLDAFRTEGQDLAVAYYRLNRALRTGYAPRFGDSGRTVSLNALRDAFDAVVDEIERETSGDVDYRNPESTGVEVEFVYEDDDEDIPLEDIGDLDELLRELDESAAEEAADVLDQLGVENLVKKLEKGEEPEQAHRDAGLRHASAAMRITMNAARGLVYRLSDTDARVVGWARYSQTGTPCSWCAMLLSRQVLYKSKSAAQHRGRSQEEDKYHDNCKCVSVPIFDMAHYRESDLFVSNRRYWDLWKKHIQGKYGGDEALRQWRRLLRNMERSEEEEAVLTAA